MAKINKFERSQNAHKRLMKKSQQSGGGFNNLVLTNYHSWVYGKQREEKRILTAKERKVIYNEFVDMFSHSPF